MFLWCKGTDNDFFEQSSFIRKLNITTKKNKSKLSAQNSNLICFLLCFLQVFIFKYKGKSVSLHTIRTIERKWQKIQKTRIITPPVTSRY